MTNIRLAAILRYANSTRFHSLAQPQKDEICSRIVLLISSMRENGTKI